MKQKGGDYKISAVKYYLNDNDTISIFLFSHFIVLIFIFFHIFHIKTKEYKHFFIC